MKKIGIAVFSLMFIAVAYVGAQDIQVNFDGKNAVQTIDVKGIITAKLDVESKETPKVIEPQVTNKINKAEPINVYRDRLVVVKDLLKNLSSKNRVKFMSNIRLIDGRVASLNYAILEENGISRTKTDEILQAFESSEEDVKLFTPIKKQPMVEMRELLRDIPEKVREDFFNNMKFLNGGIASVKTGLLEKVVTTERLTEILDALMPMVNSTKREKDEWCEVWIVNDWKEVIRSCSYQEDYTCNTSVCK